MIRHDRNLLGSRTSPPPLKSFLLLSELKIIGMLLNVVIGQILKSLQKHITEKSVRASSPLSLIDYAVTRIIFYIARYRTKCKRLEREAEQGLQVHEPVVGTSICLFVCLFDWLVGYVFVSRLHDLFCLALQPLPFSNILLTVLDV